MHLRNVEVFCDVVKHGSFSKAAGAHQVSQSSASQAVHMLERRLGCRLIDRSQRPLQLTPAGEAYLLRRLSTPLLDYRLRHVEDRVQNLEASNKVTGTSVRLAAIYSVGLLQMTEYVNRLRRRSYPDVVLQLDYLHPDEVYERVNQDEADVGIVSFPRDGGDIECIPWLDQVLGVVVAPATTGLAGKRKFGCPAQRTRRRGFCRVHPGPDESARRLTATCERQGGISVNAVHQFDNIENISRAVEIEARVSRFLPAADRQVDARSTTGMLKAFLFDERLAASAARNRQTGAINEPCRAARSLVRRPSA